MTEGKNHPKAGAPSFWEFANQVALATADKAQACEQFKRDWDTENPSASADDRAHAMAELDRIFAE